MCFNGISQYFLLPSSVVDLDHCTRAWLAQLTEGHYLHLASFIAVVLDHAQVALPQVFVWHNISFLPSSVVDLLDHCTRAWPAQLTEPHYLHPASFIAVLLDHTQAALPLVFVWHNKSFLPSSLVNLYISVQAWSVVATTAFCTLITCGTSTPFI